MNKCIVCFWFCDAKLTWAPEMISGSYMRTVIKLILRPCTNSVTYSCYDISSTNRFSGLNVCTQQYLHLLAKRFQNIYLLICANDGYTPRLTTHIHTYIHQTKTHRYIHKNKAQIHTYTAQFWSGQSLCYPTFSIIVCTTLTESATASMLRRHQHQQVRFEFWIDIFWFEFRVGMWGVILAFVFIQE